MKITKCQRRAAAAGLLLVLMVVYALGPSLIAKGWHVIHGSHITYLQRKIPVPDGWFARRQNDEVMIFSVSPSLSVKMYDFAWIRFAPLPGNQPPGPDEIYHQWKTNGSEGVAESFVLQIPGSEGFCIERPIPDIDVELSVSCMVKGRMMVFFHGRRADIAGFLNIVKHIG